MKLLLHVCCAPCLIYPLEQLREKGYSVSGFFYNPNIHPEEEYNERKKAVEDLSRRLNLEVIYPQYNPEEFFAQVRPEMGYPGRCPVCWELRLKKTALAAKEMDIKEFSTTLLVSPYQDQELLKGIGEHLEDEENVEFYYQDFRPGFREAHRQAKAEGIYCQKYCGCVYSKEEQCQKSQKH